MISVSRDSGLGRRVQRLAALATLLVAFALTAPAPAAATTFLQLDGVPIADNADATPSSLAVSGLSGALSKVRPSLIGLTHGDPEDVDVLLEGPGGQKSFLLSDACDGDYLGHNYSFDDAAPALGPPPFVPCPNGTYRPTNLDDGPSDGFMAGQPASLSGFNGIAPNGTWTLYVRDDDAGDAGSLAAWSLEIETTPPPAAAGPTGQRAAALKKCAKKKSKTKKKKCKKAARKLPV